MKNTNQEIDIFNEVAKSLQICLWLKRKLFSVKLLLR